MREESNMKNIMKKSLLTAAALGLVFAMIPAGPAQAKSKIYVAGTETEYDKDENGNWVISSVTTNTYNKKGRLTSSVRSRYEDGKKVEDYSNETKYSYNKKGLTTKIRHYYFGKLDSTTSYKYTKKGKTKSITREYDDGDTFKSVYTWKGSKIKTIKNYSSGKLTDTEKYSYSGKKIKKITTTSADGSVETAAYSYKGSRLTKVTRKYSDGSIRVSAYNKKGLPTKATYTDADGSVTTFSHSYKYYKKNYVKEEISKYSYSDGYSYEFKTVYSDWKKY